MKVNFIITAFIAASFFFCQISPYFGKHARRTRNHGADCPCRGTFARAHCTC